MIGRLLEMFLYHVIGGYRKECIDTHHTLVFFLLDDVKKIGMSSFFICFLWVYQMIYPYY